MVCNTPPLYTKVHDSVNFVKAPRKNARGARIRMRPGSRYAVAQASIGSLAAPMSTVSSASG